MSVTRTKSYKQCRISERFDEFKVEEWGREKKGKEGIGLNTK